jgi:hypothetical protein
LYVCEIKFSREIIQSKIIEEVKEKISRIKLPKHFSVMPVLIHVNGVSDQVVESELFSHIIDFSEFLIE